MSDCKCLLCATSVSDDGVIRTETTEIIGHLRQWADLYEQHSGEVCAHCVSETLRRPADDLAALAGGLAALHGALNTE